MPIPIVVALSSRTDPKSKYSKIKSLVSFEADKSGFLDKAVHRASGLGFDIRQLLWVFWVSGKPCLCIRALYHGEG